MSSGMFFQTDARTMNYELYRTAIVSYVRLNPPSSVLLRSLLQVSFEVVMPIMESIRAPRVPVK